MGVTFTGRIPFQFTVVTPGVVRLEKPDPGLTHTLACTGGQGMACIPGWEGGASGLVVDTKPHS